MGTKKSTAELVRRWLFLVGSLFIMALGVACSIQANLGTSPISSLPYVLSRFTPLTVGTATIAMNTALVLLQIAILRRRFDPVQLLQIPVAFAFGYLTDFAVWLVGFLQPAAYWQQWALCLAGIALVGVGVSCEVTAGVATMAGEGVVLAVCQVTPVKFGAGKVGFDVSLVAASCVLSLLFLGRITGVREGTVAAALLVGQVARRMRRVLEPVDRLLAGERPGEAAGRP